MMYPEALLHPEVKPLDEGFCLLLLTLAQCPSIHQSALVTKLSEALLLDVVKSLTLRVILLLSACASLNPTGSNFTWRGWFTDAWGHSILSVCASLNLTGSAFTWRSKLTDAWGDIYSISLRQSKSNRKHFLFRLNHSLVLRFVYLVFMDSVKSLVSYLLPLGDESFIRVRES